MNRTLLVGILAGVAIGAAVLYFMDEDDRDRLVSNIKDLGNRARNTVSDAFGAGDAEDVGQALGRAADNALS